MTTHPTNNSNKGALLVTLFLGILGGWFLTTTFTKPFHGNNDKVAADPVDDVSMKLSDLPNGIFSLMDEPDATLEDIYSFDLAFKEDDEETVGTQTLEIGGFERFTVASANDDEALTLESLVFSLDNSNYHSLQLLRGHDNITGEETFHMTFHDDDSTEMMLQPGRRLRHLGPQQQRRRRLNPCNNCVRKFKDCGKCKNRIRDLERDVDNLRSQVNSRAREVSSLRSQLNQRVREINSLRSQLSQRTNELKSRTNELKSWQNRANGYSNTIRSLRNQVSSLTTQARGYRNEIANLKKSVTTWTNRANGFSKQVQDLQKTVSSWKNTASQRGNRIANLSKELNSMQARANGFANQISGLRGEVKLATDAVANQAKQVEQKTISMANKLEDKVVGPIKDEIVSAKQDLLDLDELAGSVANSTVKAIKKLNFLPESGEDLAMYLGKAFKDFVSEEFCVPYSCIATAFGVDIDDIELYSSDRVRLSTALNPTTCLQVADIGFDTTKLGQFLDLFKDLDALEDIFEHVREFLVEQMNQIVKYSEHVVTLLDKIDDLASDAAEEIGLRSRRKLLVNAETEEVMTMEDVSAMAYQKGMEHFQELYGEHVNRVFRERKLNENGGAYIGLSALRLNLTANFDQTFTLKAEDRTGYAGSLFDESLHKTQVMPVPFTGGMMKIVGSGSMEAKMPYAMVMEAEANAEFGYSVGEMDVSIDVVTGDVTTNKEPFSTTFSVDAKAGVSGTMSLNFAASTSLGLCLGPTENACITLTIDASQTSAAGFDALAGLNLQENALVPMYTDELEYGDVTGCDDQLSVSAGYWQYVKEPSVKVSITGTDCCSEHNDILFHREGKVAQSTIGHECLSTDII